MLNCTFILRDNSLAFHYNTGESFVTSVNKELKNITQGHCTRNKAKYNEKQKFKNVLVLFT